LKPLQRTIQTPVERAGVGVNTGLEITVRLRPAGPDTGIIFVRADIKGSPTVPAALEHVVPKLRRTALRRGDAEVQMTEHVLAAVAALEIDNLIVELTGPELPTTDGSALIFAEMLQEAGALEQERPRRVLTLGEPITIADDSSSITALPAAQGLTISYTLDYERPALPAQHFEILVTPDRFLTELAPARTFVLESEAAGLLASGLGRGASLENTLVVRDDGSLVYGELRFPDEFARHKAVDVLGDLHLVGGALVARIVAIKTGHAHNFRLVERIRDSALKVPLSD